MEVEVKQEKEEDGGLYIRNGRNGGVRKEIGLVNISFEEERKAFALLSWR